jgi:hypothetical protein
MAERVPKGKKSIKSAEAQLDEALAESFPASDPPAMTDPSTHLKRAPSRRPSGPTSGKEPASRADKSRKRSRS